MPSTALSTSGGICAHKYLGSVVALRCDRRVYSAHIRSNKPTEQAIAGLSRQRAVPPPSPADAARWVHMLVPTHMCVIFQNRRQSCQTAGTRHCLAFWAKVDAYHLHGVSCPKSHTHEIRKRIFQCNPLSSPSRAHNLQTVAQVTRESLDFRLKFSNTCNVILV